MQVQKFWKMQDPVRLQIHQVLLISKRMHLYLTVINWQKIHRQLMQVK